MPSRLAEQSTALAPDSRQHLDCQLMPGFRGCGCPASVQCDSPVAGPSIKDGGLVNRQKDVAIVTEGQQPGRKMVKRTGAFHSRVDRTTSRLKVGYNRCTSLVSVAADTRLRTTEFEGGNVLARPAARTGKRATQSAKGGHRDQHKHYAIRIIERRFGWHVFTGSKRNRHLMNRNG